MPWRLRRATAIEAGLFDIQAEHLRGMKRPQQGRRGSREVVYALFGRAHSVDSDQGPALAGSALPSEDAPGSIRKSTNATQEFARCFLLVANLPNYALDR